MRYRIVIEVDSLNKQSYINELAKQAYDVFDYPTECEPVFLSTEEVTGIQVVRDQTKVSEK